MVLERQLSAKRDIVEAFVLETDYTAAAAAQEELKKVEALSEDLLSKKSMVDELGDKGEYARAAAVQQEIKAIEEQIMEKFALDNNDLAARPKATGPATPSKAESRSVPTPEKPPLPTRASGTPRDLKAGRNAQPSAGSGHGRVSLENVRVLSSSKVTQVQKRNKGKGGGKKGGKKGGGKKGQDGALEDCAAIFIGCINTKKIYHVLAYGHHVDKLRPYLDQDEKPIVKVTNLERRSGKDDLFVTDATVITTCLEPTDGDGSARFVYDVTDVTKHLATNDFGTQASLNNSVDLVLRVDIAEQLTVQSGSSIGSEYLVVSGVDMDGMEVGPVRLWNHDESDVEIGHIYILRGLKVATERVWDGQNWTNDRSGAKKLVNDNRTALEDVSDHPEITQYFPF